MTEGEQLTADILAAVAPLVDGLPTELALQALAAAMMMAIVVVSSEPASQRIMLRRYASKIEDFARMLP